MGGQKIKYNLHSRCATSAVGFWNGVGSRKRVFAAFTPPLTRLSRCAVVSSSAGLSSATWCCLVPENPYSLDIPLWCLKCNNFLLLLCCSLDVYSFSVCFLLISILELFLRIFALLRDAFKCFSTWWFVFMNQ